MKKLPLKYLTAALFPLLLCMLILGNRLSYRIENAVASRLPWLGPCLLIIFSVCFLADSIVVTWLTVKKHRGDE